MKKLLQLIMVLVVTLSLLTGCVSPMKKYIEAVDEAEMQDKIQEIFDEAQKLDDLTSQVFDELDTAEGDISELEGMNEVKDQLDKVEGLIDAAIEEAEAFDADDDDVSNANDDLLEGLNTCKEYTDTLNSVLGLAVEVFAALGQINDANAELMTIGTPSEGFQTALMDFFVANEEAFNTFSSLDFEATLESGEFDLDTIAGIKEQLTPLIDGIASLPIETDVDQQYADIFKSMFDALIKMLDKFEENADLVPLLSEFEGESDYWGDIQTRAQESFDSWEEAMDQ